MAIKIKYLYIVIEENFIYTFIKQICETMKIIIVSFLIGPAYDGAFPAHYTVSERT